MGTRQCEAGSQPLRQQLSLARAWTRGDHNVLVDRGHGASALGSSLRPPTGRQSCWPDHSGNSASFSLPVRRACRVRQGGLRAAPHRSAWKRRKVRSWLALQVELGVVVVEQIQEVITKAIFVDVTLAQHGDDRRLFGRCDSTL